MNTTVFAGVRITLFGHASVCLEFGGKYIYVDPYVIERGAKPADLILHTHSHPDHCAPAPSITTTNTLLIGKGCKHPGRPVQIGEKFSSVGAAIEVVDAYNVNKPFHPRGFGAGYIITFAAAPGSPAAARPPVRIYIAGDTDFIPEMSHFKCDVALLPIGGHYTMDANEAAQAVAAIKPKIVIPYHYNYLSETKADAAAFKQAVDALQTGADVRILTP